MADSVVISQRKYTDSGFSWLISGMSFCVFYAMSANVIALGLALPELLDHLQTSQAMLGILGSVKLAVFDLSSGILGGPLTQRYGCRPLAMSGLVLTTIGFLAASFVDDYYSLLVTFSIIPGFGAAGTFISTHVIVHQYHNKRRALAASLASVGLSFSTCTFPVVMRLAIESFGWRYAFIMLAGVQAQMIVAAMFFMPNPDITLQAARNKKNNSTPMTKIDKTDTTEEAALNEKDNSTSMTIIDKEDTTEEAALNENDNSTPMTIIDKTDTTEEHARVIEENVENKRCRQILPLFKNPSFVFFALAHSICASAAVTFLNFAIQRGIFQGVDRFQSSIIMSSFGICSIIGRITSGFISNMKCTRKDMQAAGCILVAGIISFLSNFSGSSLVLHAASAGGFGFVNGSYHCLYSTLLVDIVGVHELPRAMGIVQLIKCVAAAVFLPIAGHLFDTTQNYIATFSMIGACMVTSALLFLCSGIANKRKKRMADRS